MKNKFEIINGRSPIIMSAIHDGHDIREELRPYINLQEHERMREEDPYTDYLAEIADTRIKVYTSRFEVDLNRPRNKAIYQKPDDAWGLTVWKESLPTAFIGKSLDLYDEFYSNVVDLLWNIIETFGYFIVLDLHTYNHRRNSVSEAEPARDNPEINIGTASVTPAWRPLVQEFISNFSQLTLNGRKPDVRENVKFLGGEFSRWINRNFGQYGCALAIEFKKTFMDEWTGRVNIHHVNEIRQALASLLPSLKQQMKVNLQLK
jgi:N-formylglutamate amidohydrolase